MMADWLSGREIDGMLTMEIMAVMTQMASRVAATPMAAPTPESSGPSTPGPRRARCSQFAISKFQLRGPSSAASGSTRQPPHDCV